MQGRDVAWMEATHTGSYALDKMCAVWKIDGWTEGAGEQELEVISFLWDITPLCWLDWVIVGQLSFPSSIFFAYFSRLCCLNPLIVLFFYIFVFSAQIYSLLRCISLKCSQINNLECCCGHKNNRWRKINCRIQEPFTVLEPVVVNWDFRHASLLFHTLSAYSCSWLQHTKTPACFKLCSHVRTYICNCGMEKMANMCEINCTCGCFANTCECKYQIKETHQKKKKGANAHEVQQGSKRTTVWE